MNRYQQDTVHAICTKLNVRFQRWASAKNHVKVFFATPNGHTAMGLLSHSPSDRRSQQNAIGDIRRQLRSVQ